jgi:hypothetical protein
MSASRSNCEPNASSWKREVALADGLFVLVQADFQSQYCHVSEWQRIPPASTNPSTLITILS